MHATPIGKVSSRAAARSAGHTAESASASTIRQRAVTVGVASFGTGPPCCDHDPPHASNLGPTKHRCLASRHRRSSQLLDETGPVEPIENLDDSQDSAAQADPCTGRSWTSEEPWSEEFVPKRASRQRLPADPAPVLPANDACRRFSRGITGGGRPSQPGLPNIHQGPAGKLSKTSRASTDEK